MATATVAAVCKVIEDRIISSGLVSEVPRSQFWGNLKQKVYKNNSHSTGDLQNEITHVTGSVTTDQFQSVLHNLII
jgi:hypothetical protein